MKTFKITTTEKKEKEIEVGFPCYTKKGGMFYQVLSEDKITRVIPTFSEVSKSNGLEYAFGEGHELITKEQFEEKLTEVKNELGI